MRTWRERLSITDLLSILISSGSRRQVSFFFLCGSCSFPKREQSWDLILIRFQVILTPTHLAIVMEYASGGELFERICTAGRFSEAEVLYSS